MRAISRPSKRRDHPVAHVEPLALSHYELDEGRHAPVPLGSDALDPVAALEGDAEGNQLRAAIRAHALHANGTCEQNERPFCFVPQRSVALSSEGWRTRGWKNEQILVE
jgi:hypothetical protein